MNRIMILCAVFIVSTILPVAADTASVNGIEWTYTVSNGRNSDYASSRNESRMMRDTDTAQYSSNDGLINDVGSMVGEGVKDVGQGVENIGSTLQSNVDDMMDGHNDTETY